MKRLLLPLLLSTVLPALASEPSDDPIAWKCYMCAPQEREAIAIGRGLGEHIVYDASSTTAIYGYQVTEKEGRLVAAEYRLPAWLTEQHRNWMLRYDYDRGEFVIKYDNSLLYPPGSPHARTDNVLWGHHVSSLHPTHASAREIVRRSIGSGPSWMSSYNAEGRVIQYEAQLQGALPVIVRLSNLFSEFGYLEFFWDRETRTWHHLESKDYHTVIQQRAEDFLGPGGSPRTFYFSRYRNLRSYFLQRAEWAGVALGGAYLNAETFHCSRLDHGIQCLGY